MAESHTYLNYVFSNNALVIDYYQTGKGERDESRGWEVHVVCSLGVGDEAHSKCDLCGSGAGSGIRICNQGQWFYQSYTMVRYVSYLQEYWRFLWPRASGDAVCFQVVLQGNQNATYIDTSMHYLMCTYDPRSMDSCSSAWILMMGDYVNTSENERVYQVKIVRWSKGQNRKCRKYSVYSYSHTVDMWPKGSKITEVGRDLKREVHTQKFKRYINTLQEF